MTFKKYTSIENHYQAKFVDYFTRLYPELRDITYSITEKIHGSNIQIAIGKNTYKVGSRNFFLTESNTLHDAYNLVTDLFGETISKIQQNLKEDGQLILYGEIYGPKVQKGICYGDSKSIRFFGLSINELLQSEESFFNLAKQLELPTVPLLGIAKGLEEALNFDSEFKSLVYPEANYPNICEGIVIKPYNKVYYSPQGSIFYLKKKNSQFLEVSNKPKRISLEENTTLTNLKEEFKNYININRVHNVLSKECDLKVKLEKEDISKYLNKILQDAKEDFLKDHDLSDIPKKDHKSIYNVGSLVYNLLQQETE